MSTSPTYGNLLTAILCKEQQIPLTKEQQDILDSFDALSGSPDGFNSRWLKEMYEYSNTPNAKRDESCSKLREACIAALSNSGRKANVIRIFKWAPAAAAVLIAGILTFTNKPAGLLPNSVDTKGNSFIENANDFPPGESRATLYLTDNQEIKLEKSSHYKTELAGTRISVNEGDILTYQVLGTPSETSSALNRLTTPKAGKYKVQLSDGSIVHLDAATTIEYPVKFTGNVREVKLLEGQAYFEIKKGKKIFTVLNNKFRIDVLGTTFNVNTYEADKVSKATLLTGAIKFSSEKNTKILSPGQQLGFNKETDQITITQLDTTEAALWVKGYFSFNGANLKNIMKSLERWYDVSITVEGNISSNRYTLQKMDRNISLNAALRTLSTIEGFQFEIQEGRKVRVWK